MCTVVIEVSNAPSDPIRVLAVRDEDPARAWDPPGAWWENRPDMIGVRDRRAGGAWLAANPSNGRFAVILNRAEAHPHETPHPATPALASRGGLVLDALDGAEVPDPPGTASFNLVSVGDGRAVVTSWDGERLSRSELPPGVHMIAHHDANDPSSARVAAWLPEFRKLTGLGDDWRDHWVALLARTAQLSSSDDRAIIRDNRTHGYPTLSLLACIAEVQGGDAANAAGRPPQVHLETAIFAEPAVWADPSFEVFAP